eukprot:CAMPEP_0117450992 /NCGR_PEP_ID=MMETSP0759-20121206/8768_1 /TAXON_ID=63605 /ORGANISM="Percolomonas cosmopolitus, Strain WS" /LENGTH=750 /DNA_ID=CAMNT_0005243559 /DNA_START=210 /DNA_END=2463 /DNA_ORIENTATION=-
MKRKRDSRVGVNCNRVCLVATSQDTKRQFTNSQTFRSEQLSALDRVTNFEEEESEATHISNDFQKCRKRPRHTHRPTTVFSHRHIFTYFSLITLILLSIFTHSTFATCPAGFYTKSSNYSSCIHNIYNRLYRIGSVEAVSLTTVTEYPSQDFSPIEIFTGHAHTLILTKENHIYSQGRNDFEQLCRGYGSNWDDRFQRISGGVIGTKTVKMACAGEKNTLILADDGTLGVCGSNTVNQIKGGSGQSTYTHPVSNNGVTPSLIQSVACSEHGFAVVDGSRNLHMWGTVNTENIGDSPTHYSAGGEDVIKVAMGSDHVLALTDTGNVYSMGESDRSQLGFIGSDTSSFVKITFFDASKFAADIAAGWESSVVYTSNEKKLYAFGENPDSMYGVGGTNILPTAIEATPREQKYLPRPGNRHWYTFRDGWMIYGVGHNSVSQALGLAGTSPTSWTLFDTDGLVNGQKVWRAGAVRNGGLFIQLTCYDIAATHAEVCFGNGVCTDKDTCSCNTGYTGSECEFPLCFGIPSNDSAVCSSKGTCTAPKTCDCLSGYGGTAANSTFALVNCPTTVLLVRPEASVRHRTLVIVLKATLEWNAKSIFALASRATTLKYVLDLGHASLPMSVCVTLDTKVLVASWSTALADSATTLDHAVREVHAFSQTPVLVRRASQEKNVSSTFASALRLTSLQFAALKVTALNQGCVSATAASVARIVNILCASKCLPTTALSVKHMDHALRLTIVFVIKGMGVNNVS